MGRPTSRVSGVLMRGPLAPFADEFRAGLLARGYTLRTSVNQLRQSGRLSAWLDEHGLGAADVDEDRISRFLDFQRAGGRHRSQWSRPGMLCCLDGRRRTGAAPAAVETPAAVVMLAAVAAVVATTLPAVQRAFEGART